jgi:hypothetical protein
MTRTAPIVPGMEGTGIAAVIAAFVVTVLEHGPRWLLTWCAALGEVRKGMTCEHNGIADARRSPRQ